MYDQAEFERAGGVLDELDWDTLIEDLDAAQEALDDFDGEEEGRLTEEFEAQQEEYQDFKDAHTDAKAATKEIKDRLKTLEREIKANADPEAVQELNDRMAEL